jgi:hypothetical protein
VIIPSGGGLSLSVLASCSFCSNSLSFFSPSFSRRSASRSFSAWSSFAESAADGFPTTPMKG